MLQHSYTYWHNIMVTPCRILGCAVFIAKAAKREFSKGSVEPPGPQRAASLDLFHATEQDSAEASAAGSWRPGEAVARGTYCWDGARGSSRTWSRGPDGYREQLVGVNPTPH